MPKGALSHRPKVLEDLKPICDQAKSIWATPELTHYTDHSVLHSTRVIKHINDLADLLPRSDELNSNEAFVLLAAALLHDVGMQYVGFFKSALAKHLFPDEVIAKGQSSDALCEELLREHHHLIGAEWIRHDLSRQWPRRDFVEEIADVAKGHSKIDLTVLQDYRKAGERMRTRLLAALLRLADELDLDYRRVDLDRLKHASIAAESKAHWWKCHYVESVDVLEHGQIQVTFRFSSEDTSQVRDIIRGLVLDGLRQKIEDDQLMDLLWNKYGLSLKIDEAVVLPDAGATARKPVPQSVLDILRRDYDSLIRERFASQLRTVTLPDTQQAETEPARPATIPSARQSQQSMLQEARELWTHGEPQEAVRTLERAAALYPESAAVQTMLGDLLLSRGQWRKAEVAARTALSSEPGGVLARLTLGVAHGRSGDHIQAVEHLRITDLACQSISVPARYHARVHMAIASSLAALGDYWYALERIDSAHALFDASGTAPDDQADRELNTAATEARNSAEAMILEAGSWEISKLRLQGVLGRWAKEPIVRLESLTTLMEGMLVAGSSRWVDYVFECDFQLVNLAAGFLLRADAWATTGLMAQIIPRKLRIHQMVHSNYFAGPLIEIDLPAPLRLYQWHQVRFEVRANKLKTWIDEKPVGEWIEFLDLYRSGKVGFRLWGREFTLYKNPRVTATKMWTPRQE